MITLKRKCCRTCKITKPVSKFYLHPSKSKDGYDLHCKLCVLSYQKEYKKTSPVYRASLKKLAKRLREKRKLGLLKEKDRKHALISRKRFPKKAKARLILRNAIQKGSIIKPKICEDCGKRKKLHGHHENYNKPLEVNWLCIHCHHLLHNPHLKRQLGKRGA